MTRNHHRYLVAVTAAVLAAILAPAASAAITPQLLVSPNSLPAGSSSNVSLDLTFGPTGTDSPKDLTVTLPPGLLANAAIDGGACLTSTSAVAACHIGSGTVTATLDALSLLGPLNAALSLPVSFYLVVPPRPSDLAGVLTVANAGTPLATDLGPPAEVTVRPATDPAGVGLTERFTNLPDTFQGVPISVKELNSTFTKLRVPTRCPTPAARIAVSADSYADTTARTASAPLTVTSCSALPFAPQFHVSATRDSADSGVQVVTDITQKANEATSRNVSLTLPPTVLSPNAAAVLRYGLLCTSPTFAGCTPIGTASSTSPLYPRTLTGQDYLTGSLTAPALTIRFPPPFALTIRGAVGLATGTTTFTNLPDLPLTDLRVTLTGGPAAAFAATCNPASGTATSALTTQDGDRSVTDAAPYTVACSPTGGGGSGASGGSGAGSGSGTPGGAPGAGGATRPGRPTLSGGVINGLGHDRPSLRFTATAGRAAPKLSTLIVGLPRGLTIVSHRHARRLILRGLSLRGARASGLSISHSRLLIRLRRAVNRVTVILRPGALHEAGILLRSARRHRVHRLTLGVQLRDAAHHLTRLTLVITHIRN